VPTAPDPTPADETPLAIAREDFHAALLDDDAQRLYDQAPCGYLSTTPDGLITKVNQTFLTWTGHTREELVGRRTFAELLTPGGRIYHETHYAPMLRLQGTVREIALEVVRADRTRLPILVNAVLDRDADGAPAVVRVAIFDATDRRAYERELLHATRQAEQSEARAIALSRTLQQTLIPPSPPQIPGLDVAAVYRPAGDGSEVGGDFYDVFQLGEGDWAVVLGDVAGKGVDAAILTSLVRYSLRALSVRISEPGQVLQELNQVLLRHDTERFCTLTFLRLRCVDGGWTVTMSSGGHAPPLLTAPGRVPRPVGEHGSLIGAFETGTYPDSSLRLQPGEMLLLYTDGVTEGRRGDEFFGEIRLIGSAASHLGTAAQLTDGVLEDVLAFQEEFPRDDIAIVAIGVPLD
jgi:sigma-B regulation protein RsbU (phosphoserine phosphatase)